MPCATGRREELEQSRRDRDSEQAFRKSPFWKAWLYASARSAEPDWSSLEPELRCFYAMNLFRGATLRRGVFGFFDLASPDCVRLASQSYRQAGGTRISAIIDSASQILFPDGLPLDPVSYQEHMDAFGQSFDPDGVNDPPWEPLLEPLSREFYALADHSWELLTAFFEQSGLAAKAWPDPPD